MFRSQCAVFNPPNAKFWVGGDCGGGGVAALLKSLLNLAWCQGQYEDSTSKAPTVSILALCQVALSAKVFLFLTSQRGELSQRLTKDLVLAELVDHLVGKGGMGLGKQGHCRHL